MDDNNKSQEHNSDGTDVADIFIVIWSKRKTMLFAGLLALLASLAFIAFTRIAMPTVQTYQTTIRFLFEGAKRGEYPNMSAFAPTDMLSPNILKKVYHKNDLARFKISESDFIAAATVKPYSVMIDSIMKRYNERLNDKKMSFVERQKIEVEMKKELEQKSVGTVLLRLTFLKRFPIPKILGEKILSDIPTVWAATSIDELGVVKLPPVAGVQDFIDVKNMNHYDPLVRMEFLTESASQLGAKLEVLKKYNAIATLLDKETGLNIDELKRKISFFTNYDIPQLNIQIIKQGVLADRTKLKEFLKSRLEAVEIKKDNLEKRAQKVKESLFFYDRSGQSAFPGDLSVTQNDKTVSQDRTSPQVNEGFINKIIELTQQKRDTDFRQDLVQKYMSLYENSLFFAGSQKRIKGLIDSIETIPVNTDVAQAKDPTPYIEQAAKMLNGFNKTLFNIQSALEKMAFPESKQLYQELVLSSDMAYQSYHPIINKFTFIISFLAIIAVIILTLFASLILNMLKQSPD